MFNKKDNRLDVFHDLAEHNQGCDPGNINEFSSSQKASPPSLCTNIKTVHIKITICVV